MRYAGSLITLFTDLVSAAKVAYVILVSIETLAIVNSSPVGTFLIYQLFSGLNFNAIFHDSFCNGLLLTHWVVPVAEGCVLSPCFL